MSSGVSAMENISVLGVRASRAVVNKSQRVSALLSSPAWVSAWAFFDRMLEIKGISQAQWAKSAGVSPSLVSKVRAGEKPLTFDALVRLCRALDCDTRHVFPGELVGVRR